MKKHELSPGDHNEFRDLDGEHLSDVAEVVTKFATLIESLPSYEQATRTDTSLNFFPFSQDHLYYPDAVVEQAGAQNITDISVHVVQRADNVTENTKTIFEFAYGTGPESRMLYAVRSSTRDIIRDELYEDTPQEPESSEDTIYAHNGHILRTLNPIPDNQLSAFLFSLIGQEAESYLARDSIGSTQLDSSTLLASLVDHSVGHSTDLHFALPHGRSLQFNMDYSGRSESLNWLEFCYETSGGNTVHTSLSQAEGFRLDMDIQDQNSEITPLYPDKDDYIRLNEILDEEINRLV